MSAALRAGLVGCGRVAGNHVAALSAHPDVDLVGVADTAPGRAQRFAAEHRVPAVVDHVDALLDLGLDLVVVATPHPTHEAVVLAAAARGVHVLCEKPIAVDLPAADRMIAACDAAGVTLGVVFQRRLWPAARAIRAAIDDGRLGEPVLGHASLVLHRDADYYGADPWRGTWAADGGGVLTTQGVHNVDLLCWYLGDCVEVSARHATVRHPIEVEDTAVAILRFASGALATLAATTAATPGLGTRVQITGSSGATFALSEYPEGAEGRLHVHAVPGAADLSSEFGPGAVPDPTLAQINGALAPFHADQVADFVDAVRRGRPPAVTGREARRSLAVLTAAYASAASGEAVTVTREESLL